MIEQMSEEEWEKWSKVAHEKFKHLKGKLGTNIVEDLKDGKKQLDSRDRTRGQLYNEEQ